MFYGGPTISETPEQMHEKMEDVPELKNVEMNGAGMYAPFNETKKGKNIEIENDIKEPNTAESGEKLMDYLGNNELDLVSVSFQNNDKGNDVKSNNETGEKLTINQETKENEVKLKEFSRMPTFPILERFAHISGTDGNEINLLSQEDMIELSSHIDSNEENLIEAIRKGLIKSEFNDPNVKEYLRNYLSKIDSINNEKRIDGEGNIFIPDELKTIDVIGDNQDREVVQLLLENYIKFPEGGDAESIIDQDLDTAFQITLNKIIDNKVFNKTDGYNIAVQDIKYGTIKEQLEGLEYIFSLVNTSEGMKGAKSKSSFNKIKEQHNTNKLKYVDFKIQQIEDIIQSANKSDSEKMKLQQELIILTENKNKDDFEGDIFSGDIQIEGIGEENIGEGKESK